MCGVYGFIARGKDGPNMERLRQMALAAETRGPHAFGWAFVNRDGRLLHYKSPGRVSEHLGLMDELEGCRAVIGHCRYATAGSPDNNLNNHPFACDGGFIVHNGTIPSADRILDRKGLRAVSQCDSELLALLVEIAPGRSWRERVTWTVERVSSVAPALVLAGLWKPGHLVLARAGNPLFVGAGRRGVYFCSLAGPLPDEARAMADDTVREYAWPLTARANKRRVRCAT
jgi:glucosamine 6-phosphate synthetase-like amidotransferase/phosphosugar isomerase protein